jgi:hypothetical protein
MTHVLSIIYCFCFTKWYIHSLEYNNDCKEEAGDATFISDDFEKDKTCEEHKVQKKRSRVLCFV